MRSLRTRLIISHSLPLLITVLLAGLALDYAVETRVLLPGFADELTNEARLLAELTALQPRIWDDPQTAQTYLAQLEPTLPSNVTIFNAQGELLSSTAPLQNPPGLSGVQLEEVLAEDVIIRTAYSRSLQANVVDVFVPVRAGDQTVLGIIQMTYQLENIYGRFLALRRIIIGILSIGVILGVGIALFFALNLSRTLHQIVVSVQQLAGGQKVEPLSERGPEEIRSLIQTVNLLVTRLHTLETTRRKLLANLVHELGRPLGAVLPAVQALEAGAVEDEHLRRDLLAGITDELGILRRLLDDLTGLYGRSVGSFELERQWVNLNEWLPNLFRLQREAARAKGLHWESAICDSLPALEIDPERLAQAIGNLIDNAIKFTPSGGMVTAQAGVQAGEVWIRVKDTGPGIPVQDQALIFTPFFRGRTETRFPQGMGLGLSITRDLVIAHQGRLEFESQPGEGSCFTIWLPISPVERPAE